MGLFNFGTPEMRLQSAMKYADDYETVLVENEKGKVRKKTVYKGVWFFVRNDLKETRLLTVSSLLLAVLAFLSTLSLEFLSYGSQRCPFVSIPQAVALFPGLYAVMGTLELPYKRKPMERNRYMHGIIRMCRAGAVGAVLLCVALVAGFVWRAVKGDWLFLTGDVLHLVFQILSGLLFAAVTFVLQKLDVSERPNEYFVPTNE